MGALLLSIKRRLLGSGNGKREVPADATADAGAETPPPPKASTSPPARLPLPTPRRVPLGGLAAELASLEQRFAALPQHQPASKEGVRARLAALQSSPAGEGAAGSIGAAAVLPSAAAAARADGKPSKAGGRLPRRLAKATRRPAAARRPWVDVAPPPAASREPPALTAAASVLSVASDTAVAPAPPAHLRSKLANLKRRQARRSAEGAAWASPGGGEGLLSPQASEGPEAAAQQQPSGWLSDRPASVSGTDGSELSEGPHSVRAFLLSHLTPRVLAAASRRASTASQPRSRLASEAGSSEAGGRARRRSSESSGRGRTSSSDGGGELGLTLSPWAVPAASEPTPQLPARHTSSAGALPDLGMQAQQRWPATWTPAAAGAEAQEAPPPSQPPGGSSPARSTTRLMQRLSPAELPADLLSLRDSASLARRQSLSGRPPLPPQRRAQSEQEVQLARGGEEAPAAMPVGPSAAGQHAAAGSIEGAERIAVPRRQRRGWLSDFAATVPGWRASQETEASGLLPPLKPAAAGYASSRRPSLRPKPPAATHAEQPQMDPATDADGTDTAVAAPSPVAGPSPGLTLAQRRQQEAWGSLAGVDLADVLRQAPHRTQARQPQPQPLDVGGEEVADRENSTLSFNSGSPSKASSPTAAALQASPKPAEQQSLQGSPASPTSPSKAVAGMRQGHRRTLPQPMLVESLERLAALHRVRSESEQQEGGIEWRLPPAMRGSRSPVRATARVPEQLPPLHSSSEAGSGGAFTAELHALRQRCPGGILANARRRDSWKHTTPPSPAAAPPAAPPAAPASATGSPQANGQTGRAAPAVQPSPTHGAASLDDLPAGIPVDAAATAAVAAAAVTPPAPQAANHTPRAQQQAGGGPASTQQPGNLQLSPQQPVAQAQAAQQQAMQWRQRQVQYLRGLAPQHRNPQQAQLQQHYAAAQQMQPQLQQHYAAQQMQPQQQQAQLPMQAQQRQPQQAQAAHQQVGPVPQQPHQYAQPQAPLPAAPAHWWPPQQAQQGQRPGHALPPQQQQAWAHAQQQAAYQQAAWAQQQRQQQQQQQTVVGQQAPSGRRKWQVPTPMQAAAGFGPAPQRQQAAAWTQQAPSVQQQYWAAGQPQHAASPYGWQHAGGAAHPAAVYSYGGAAVGYQWQQQAHGVPGYGSYQAQGSLPPLGHGYAR